MEKFGIEAEIKSVYDKRKSSELEPRSVVSGHTKFERDIQSVDLPFNEEIKGGLEDEIKLAEEINATLTEDNSAV